MGGGVGGEKDNLVNWDVVSEDKEKRGFGAPMGRERDALWYAVIRSKYRLHGNGWVPIL